MPATVVFAVYGTSFLIAALLLLFFHERAWYLHLLAVAAAIALGLARLPDNLHGPVPDLVVGAVFLLLFVWGTGGPVVHAFRVHRLHRHV